MHGFMLPFDLHEPLLLRAMLGYLTCLDVRHTCITFPSIFYSISAAVAISDITWLAAGVCVCLCKWARAKELPTFSLFCVRINGTCANAINWIKNQLKIVSSSSNNVREARTSRLCQVCVTRTIHKNGLNVFPDLIYSAVIDLIMEKLCPNTHHKRCQ